MKSTFDSLCQGHNLTEIEAYGLFQNICEGNFNASQISAIIAFYIARPITVQELTGFKNALLDVCVPVNLNKEAIDVCGTGGDQKNTFNISTLSAIVIAASGVPVAKHGNYGSSSVSGSSDILNYLGYQFKNNSDDLNKELDKHNICFMHAPLFHPTLKTVATQRKELGVRTLFNMLGPIANPAKVKYRYIGVYGLDIARMYHYMLQQSNANYAIVHSLDGYDEVSLTNSFKFITPTYEKTIEPIDLGFQVQSQLSISGGNTMKESADIFLNVLKNECTLEQKNVVLINSALAMQCYNNKLNVAECIDICRESIESKKVYTLFKNLTTN
jgi:anthranilate phosphoribosyltransferase